MQIRSGALQLCWLHCIEAEIANTGEDGHSAISRNATELWFLRQNLIGKLLCRIIGYKIKYVKRFGEFEHQPCSFLLNPDRQIAVALTRISHGVSWRGGADGHGYKAREQEAGVVYKKADIVYAGSFALGRFRLIYGSALAALMLAG